MTNKFDVVASMASLDTIDTNGISVRSIAGLTSVEVVHGEGGVAGDFVQTLSIGDGFFHSVLVVEDLVTAHDGLHPTRQAQPTEAVIKNLVELESSGGVIGDLDPSG